MVVVKVVDKGLDFNNKQVVPQITHSINHSTLKSLLNISMFTFRNAQIARSYPILVYDLYPSSPSYIITQM